MSTNINISVGDNKLLAQASFQQNASRQAQLEKEANKRLQSEAEINRVNALAAQGKDANGNPLTGTRNQVPQLERRPAANRAGSIEAAFAFTEFGFLNAGQQGSTRLYYSSNYEKVTGFQPPGPNYEDVFNPAWDAITSASKKVPYQGAVLQFENSLNCGGSNDNVQRAELSLYVKATKQVYGRILIYGTGEVEATNFERFVFTRQTAPNYTLATASSKGGSRGCATAETVNYFPVQIAEIVSWESNYDAIIGTLIIPAGVTRYILNLDTGDNAYHVNAFYSFKWAFKSSIGALPPLSYP